MSVAQSEKQDIRHGALGTHGHGLTISLLVLTSAGFMLTTSVMGVLLEPIRAEYNLSDASLGFLANAGFGLGQVLASLPGGSAVDHWNRRNILVLCLTVAGLVTAVGSLGGILGIIAMRIIAGIFHGPGSPAATSIISDIYPANRRASIMGIYLGSQSVGTLITYLAGGYIALHYGWRATLVSLGIASVVAGLLLRVFLREPARGQAVAQRLPNQHSPNTTPSLGETLAFLWSQKAAVYTIAFSVLAVATLSSTLVWLVSFYVRIFHMSLAAAGSLVAVGAVSVSALGVLIGGILTDAVAKRDARWKVGVAAILIAVATAAVLAMALATTVYWAIAFMAVWAVGIHSHLGPAWGLTQTLIPSRMRGRVIAILSGLSTFVGFGLGPALVGTLSQLMQPYFGQEAIRYAMAGANLVNLLVLYCCYKAVRHLPHSLAKMEAPTSAQELVNSSIVRSSETTSHIPTTVPTVKKISI